MQKALILGATSTIGKATITLLLENNYQLHLMARDINKLEGFVRQLNISTVETISCSHFDANNLSEIESCLDNAINQLGDIDLALIAYGELPNQSFSKESIEQTINSFSVNATSTIAILAHLANYFEIKGNGTLAAISSVAGDRGRQSNYLYGASKAAVSVFLEGLRNRLHPHGVNVLTIKPGLVDSAMTKDFNKSILWSRPELIAKGIVEAIDRKRDIVYLPAYWRLIMCFIKLIPENIFKRLKL